MFDKAFHQASLMQLSESSRYTSIGHSMKSLFTVGIIMMSGSLLSGQRNAPPKNIDQAIAILMQTCPDSIKRTIALSPDDSLLYLAYPWGNGQSLKIISDWMERRSGKQGTRFTKYYESLGVELPRHIQEIVLITFKYALTDSSLNHDWLVAKYRLKEQIWQLEDERKFSTDTLRGIYIPQDLNDSFLQLDRIFSDSIKQLIVSITEDDFTAKSHMSTGIWMRNNWQFWSGSRLSKYFNYMGIYHPDDMSGIILTSYQRRLKNQDIRIVEQIQFYRDYWEKAEKR